MKVTPLKPVVQRDSFTMQLFKIRKGALPHYNPTKILIDKRMNGFFRFGNSQQPGH